MPPLLTMPAPIVASRAATDLLQVGGNLVIPTFAGISVSTIGDNLVVAGVALLQIRVISYSLVCNAAVVVTWKSSVAGAISGPMSFGQSGGISPPTVPLDSCRPLLVKT